MRVLVTGATGFLGTGIVNRLIRAGHEPIRCARKQRAGVDIVSLDITDPSSCAEVIRNQRPVDVVVHAAALAHVKPGPEMEALCRRTNVDGSKNIVEAAQDAGIKRIVYISSVVIYGDFGFPARVTEESPPRPTSIYGKTKLDAERLIGRAGVDAHILRMATMYSEDWLFNVRKRVRMPLPWNARVYFRLNPHSPRYSLCSRDNAAEAVLWAVENRMPPGTYNVSDDHEYRQEEILQAVRSVEGGSLCVRIPMMVPKLIRFAGRFMPGEARQDNSASRYWRFCERNIFPADRLRSHGFSADPQLLSLASSVENQPT